jgi:hypothetical protein
MEVEMEVGLYTSGTRCKWRWKIEMEMELELGTSGDGR